VKKNYIYSTCCNRGGAIFRRRSGDVRQADHRRARLRHLYAVPVALTRHADGTSIAFGLPRRSLATRFQLPVKFQRGSPMQSTTTASEARRSCALALIAWPTTSRGRMPAADFSCSRSPGDQTSEHIIFTVNDEVTPSTLRNRSITRRQGDFRLESSQLRGSRSPPNNDVLGPGHDRPRYRGRNRTTSADRARFSSRQGVSIAAPGLEIEVRADAGVTVLASRPSPLRTVTLEGTSADVLVNMAELHGLPLTTR